MRDPLVFRYPKVRPEASADNALRWNWSNVMFRVESDGGESQ
jgi:hypothetical protein